MELKKSTIPEIQRCSLATVILQLKVLGVRDVMSFDFLQPPDTKAMVRALESLKMLGALKEDAGQRSRGGGRVASTDRPVKTTSSATFLKLTPLGRRMAELPLEPHFALALIRSCDDDISCSKEMLTVISMLSVENPFVSPANKREHAANAHRRFTAPSGDHLTLLNLYASFESECLAGGAGSRRGGDGGNAMMTKWLADNFINGRAMRRAVKIRKQLLERCSQLGMSIVSCQDRRAGVGRGGSTTSFMTSAEGDESVRRGLVAGLFLRTAEMLPGVHDDEDSMEVQDRKKGKRRTRGGAEYTRRKFKTMTEGIEVSVHPGSSLFSRRRQDAMGLAGRRRKHFVVFTELVLTKKAYMRGVSNIDGAWLRELAPQCFS
jgi:ATP-dependent RNA helicase DHX8/PRP22